MAVSPVTPLEARRVINGREGKVFAEGSKFLGWVQSIEARITIDRADVVRTGSITTGYKPTGVSGTGTLNGYHVTSYWRRLVAQYMMSGKMPEPCQIVMELSDPDQFPSALGQPAGVEVVTLKGVYFWETALGYDTGDIVMDDFPFTFEGLEWPLAKTIRNSSIDPATPLIPLDHLEGF